MIVFRWITRIALAFVILVGLVVVGARFHDGPLGPLPGGALASGELSREPVADWSFAAEVQEIEMQLETQSRSRTTWLIVHEGKAFIPCSSDFPPGKSWHRSALEDGRAVVRVNGRRYPVTLRRVEDASVLAPVREVGARKYPRRPAGELWLFALTSRSSGG